MPGEGLPTRVRVILIERQINYGRLMADLLDRRPGLEVVAQAGSLSQARRRTTIARFNLTDLMAALNHYCRTSAGGSSSGSPLARRGQGVPIWAKRPSRRRQCYAD